MRDNRYRDNEGLLYLTSSEHGTVLFTERFTLIIY